ncbi:MAG: N-acetylmuramoyl-L-alanine amidase [Saprospiraceae bacterium]
MVEHEDEVIDEPIDQDAGADFDPDTPPPAAEPGDDMEYDPDSEPLEPPVVPTVPQHKPRYLWCLDNGHGNLSPGKRSPVLPEGKRFYEYEFNRDIVARIERSLRLEGVKYFVVVPEVRVGNFLNTRVLRANTVVSPLPKLFVSVHANAGPARTINDFTADSVRGIETWYYHGSARGQKMAAIFQQHLIEKTGFKNRHLKSNPGKQFYVLSATRMPAVLTESGFFNNRFEVVELNKDAVRQQIADAHVAAIMQIERTGL